MEIITRQEAKVKGFKRYFTGKPCNHGHISERRVCNHGCVECNRQIDKVRSQSQVRKHLKSYYESSHKIPFQYERFLVDQLMFFVSKISHCKNCNKPFSRLERKGQQTCSEACSNDLSRLRIKDWIKENLERYLDCKRRSRIRNSWKYDYGTGIQRARWLGIEYEIINRGDIFKRDGWKCQLCGCDTPRELKGKNLENSPELDHIIPLSRGGTHTKDNVQCLCRKCNSLKSNLMPPDLETSRPIGKFWDFYKGPAGARKNSGLLLGQVSW